MKEAAWSAGSGRKMEADQVRAFEALSERFGNRFRRHERSEDDVAASILPLHADDVRWASQIATRCALPIVPVGAGTAPDDGSGARRNAVHIRFDLMSGVSLSKDDAEWADAEPGATWLRLDDELHRRGRSLAVYPTSAPRATGGGSYAGGCSRPAAGSSLMYLRRSESGGRGSSRWRPTAPAGGTRVRWRRGPPPNTGRRRSGGRHPGDRLALRRDADSDPGRRRDGWSRITARSVRIAQEILGVRW